MHFSVLTRVPENTNIEDMLYPYSECCEDEEYLEFDDHTSDVVDEFNERCKGDLEFSMLFKDVDEYNELECGYNQYGEGEDKRYGYWYNPRSFYDWYSIGGRWGSPFIVKDDKDTLSCYEPSAFGEIKGPELPKGYKWTALAQKSKIEWKMMYDVGISELKREFKELEEMFTSGESPKDSCYHIDTDGIYYFGNLAYEKDETVEHFVEKNSINKDCPIPIYGTFDIEEEYIDHYSYSGDWEKYLKEFINATIDTDYLCVVDCHD